MIWLKIRHPLSPPSCGLPCLANQTLRHFRVVRALVKSLRQNFLLPARVAQWIERLPPEQKVEGPIPSAGTSIKLADHSDHAAQ